ncbi:hypothetical protein BH20ACT8_BH20ACT8_12720 [soil metagenome]
MPEPVAPHAARTRRRRRPLRLLGWFLALLLPLGVTGLGAAGWYYADEILLVPPAADTDFPLEVVEVDGRSVTLRGEDADTAGVLGLDWGDGYARVGDGARDDGRGVARELTVFPDRPSAGDRARLDGYAAPADLSAVLDADVLEVAVEGPLGDYPATYVPGDGDRWVVFVHGRGASRAEAYRLLPSVVEQGHPALAISYRNDEGAPADPDGEYGLGWTEAADLRAAVDFASARGAEDVVLVGYSMGGAVVGNYLRQTGGLGVAGVVYDAPVLSWGDTLALEARNRGVPAVLTPYAQVVAWVRAGIRFDLLDQVARADELRTPVLLFHGTADQSVPVASSDAFAEARTDLVTYVRLDGVGHVRAWNDAPAAYEQAVRAFMERLPAVL